MTGLPPPRVKTIQILTPGMRNPLLNCGSELSKRFPKHSRLLMVTLVAPWEVERKSLFLMTSGTTEMWLRDYCVIADLTSPLWGLAFLVSGDTMKLPNEKQATVPRSYGIYEAQQWVVWPDTKGAYSHGEIVSHRERTQLVILIPRGQPWKHT